MLLRRFPGFQQLFLGHIVQLYMQTAHLEVAFDHPADIFKICIIPDQGLIDHHIAHVRTVQNTGRVHLSNGLHQGQQALPILALGLAHAHHKALAVVPSVRSCRGHGAIPHMMGIVACQSADEDFGTALHPARFCNVVQLRGKPPGHAIGQGIIVAEELTGFQNLRPQVRIGFPVVFQGFHQMGHGSPLLIKHKLLDHGQGVDDAGNTHDVHAADLFLTAELGGRFAVFDTAVQQKSAENVDILGPHIVEGICIKQDPVNVLFQLLPVDLIKFLEILRLQDVLRPVVQGVGHGPGNIAGTAAEPDRSRERGLVTTHHGVLHRIGEGHTADVHQSLDSWLVVDKGEALVGIMPFAIQHEFQHLIGCFPVPPQAHGGPPGIQFHQGLHHEPGQVCKAVLSPVRIAADGKVTFGAAVGVAAGIGSKGTEMDEYLAQQILGFLPGDLSLLQIPDIQGVQGPVNGTHTVRQELETENNAVQRFIEAFRRLSGHLSAGIRQPL